MSEEQQGWLERRLRVCGALVSGGLLVEVVSLQWAHPTAFLLFALLGGALVGLGVLVYLYALVSVPRRGAGA
jgi:hypothetical protein